MKKFALGVIYLLIVIVLVFIAYAQTDNMLISPARLEKVPIGYGSYGIENFYKLFDNEEGEETIDVNMIDTYPNNKVSSFFLNTIHVADYTGKPKFNFRFYENEKSRFKLLNTQYAESRTRSQLYIKKITVFVDEEGKLPFTNLGKIGDLYNKVKNSPSSRVINREGQGFTSYSLPGHHGTYDYSDTPGNRLSDDPFPPSKIYFDVFIDANIDGHYNLYGNHYYSLGKGYVKEDGDYYLYPETPSFSVERNTIRSFKSCCICEENAVELYNLGDITDCKAYCAKAGQATVSWNKGMCEVEEGGTFLPFEGFVDVESASQDVLIEEVENVVVQNSSNSSENSYDDKVETLGENEYVNEDAEVEIKKVEELIKEDVNLQKNAINFDKAKIPVLVFVVLIVIIASI